MTGGRSGGPGLVGGAESGEMVALDLETTGFDARRDAVIEVGAVTFQADQVLGRMEELADPGRPVPDDILALTGIRPEELLGASRPEDALRHLAEFAGQRTVVGHGARLDADFLAASGLWGPGLEVLDTLDLARALLPDAESYSLPHLCRELGLSQPRPHRALDDADATRQLLLRLGRAVSELPSAVRSEVRRLASRSDVALSAFLSRAAGYGGDEAAFAAPLPEPEAPRRRPAAEVDDSPPALARLLDPDGPLQAHFPDFEVRDSQIQMLTAAAQLLRRGGRLVVEAGTGTGKSLAYLIPAAARAVARGERVVISTYTHTLQEQLLGHDIPELRRWLPFDFEAGLLKGRSNYVSWRRWQRYREEPCRDSQELAFKLRLLLWLTRTTTGDRSEIRIFQGEEPLWAKVASDPADCANRRCTSADCFVHRARANAELADLLVVNHSLLLADAGTNNNLLPPYQHLVVDEAHHLEEAATRGLESALDFASLEAELASIAASPSLLPGLRPHSAEAPLEAARAAARRSAELVQALAQAWRRQLSQMTSQGGRTEPTVRITKRLRQTAEFRALAPLAADLLTALAALDADLRRAAFQMRGEGESALEEASELEITRERLEEEANLLQEALIEGAPNRVYWFRLSSREAAPQVRSAPLSVGPLLEEGVYRDLESVLFTSASLSVGSDFGYFFLGAGLSPQTETLVLPSPFDYPTQALLCLPRDLPDPQAPDFDSVVEEVVVDVARRLGGRSLVLFTSHGQLRTLRSRLAARPELERVTILAQGVDGQRGQLLRAFSQADQALLLGTSSLWEGVDLPGEQLSCVLIARLPFPVPSEPIFAARSELVSNSFYRLAVPMAALRLKQGFGRLIRRRTDRGAVVVLDGRLTSRDYGRSFLAALPPAHRFEGTWKAVGERVEGWVRHP